MTTQMEAGRTLVSPDAAQRISAEIKELRDALGKMILGQEELIEFCLYGILARGHILLEGLPGLGKTELIKSLASLTRLQFRRIQFTPDLLPSDITGAPILQEDDSGKRGFEFQQGPLFANLVLADEINRASPKTQSAMLEAMQERRVTVLGETRSLPQPFFVLATQNPIELEGTYPLPEAQLDRFLFKVLVNRVGSSVLADIVSLRHRGEIPALEPVLDVGRLNEWFAAVDSIYLPPAVADYIGRLVVATHPGGGPAELTDKIKFGASPRAAIALAESARARALSQGRPGAGFEDVRAVARSSLTHRIQLQYSAKLDGLTSSDIIDQLLGTVAETARSLPKGMVDG